MQTIPIILLSDFQIRQIILQHGMIIPPSPKDNFDEENDYWDTMIAMKRINASDVRQVIPRRNWSSGTTYDMYRHDYSRSNTSAVSGSTNLYTSNFYVLNSDYRVYICLQNGTNPENTLVDHHWMNQLSLI